MSPKFRGGSDDWMDDEGSSSFRKGGIRSKKKPAARSTFLAPELANATVAEVFPKLCRVRFDVESAEVATSAGAPGVASDGVEAGGSRVIEILCSYRRAGVVGQADTETRERTPVAVGDRVQASRTSPDSGVIEGVCERRNRLMRPAPGRDAQQHVLAANLDVVVIVASSRSPEFSPGLVDRFLVGAQAAGIDVVLCVTKMDLAAGDSTGPWRIYQDLGWSVYPVSAREGRGIEPLREALVGKTVVFCGSSGVGKTSVLRSLLEADIGRIGDVSEATGKGKHTTTSAVLMGGPGASRWIDTPGVREFGLAEIEADQLREFFPELRGLACEVASCSHSGEAGCRATALPRYASYLRMLESLRSGEG